MTVGMRDVLFFVFEMSCVDLHLQSRFDNALSRIQGGSTVQFRIRVPMILGLFVACCHTSASAQINSGHFTGDAPLPAMEPFYDTGCYTTGCYRDTGPVGSARRLLTC